MNPQKLLLVAALALAPVVAVRAEISAQAWLETYYLNPEPEALAPRIRALSQQGFFEQRGHTALGIGFLATAFTQNPARLDGWLTELNGLPKAHLRLLAAALWQAGHDAAPYVLRTLSVNSPVRDEVMRLADLPAQLLIDTPVRSTSSMNLHWGAFLASGDERHIVRILDAMGMGELGLDLNARLALAQNAAAHPRVMEICRAQLEREPAEVQGTLRAVLNSAAPAPRS